MPIRLNLRFRTRLALVMFVTMACTSAILTWGYFNHRSQILNYVEEEARRLITVSQLAQTQIPPNIGVDEALKIYQDNLQKLGLKSVSTISPGDRSSPAPTPRKWARR